MVLGLPDVAIGAIFAATIAGAISLIGLIISKEQKVSEFRQAWIDSLRAEVSAIIAHANAIHAGICAESKWENVRDDYVGINVATALVRLRLNPKESLSAEVLACISELELLLKPGQRARLDQLNEVEKRLATHAQRVLKQEWNRVQRGELMFRLAKFTAFAVIVLLPLALLVRTILGA